MRNRFPLRKCFTTSGYSENKYETYNNNNGGNTILVLPIKVTSFCYINVKIKMPHLTL